MVGYAAFRTQLAAGRPLSAVPPHLAPIPIAAMNTTDKDEQHMIRLRKRAEMQPSDDEEEEEEGSLGKPNSHSDAFALRTACGTLFLYTK